MKKLKTLIIMLLVLGCGISGAIYEVGWAENIFSFVTIALGITGLLSYLTESTRQIYIDSYLKIPNSHLPGWVDYVYYLTIIAVSASVGWYVCATCWVLIAGFDATYREEANKKIKAKVKA